MTDQNLNFPCGVSNYKPAGSVCNLSCAAYWNPVTSSISYSCIDVMLQHVALCDKPLGCGCACARQRAREHCVHVSINTQLFCWHTSCAAKYYPSVSCWMGWRSARGEPVWYLPAFSGTCQISRCTVSLAWAGCWRCSPPFTFFFMSVI